MAPHTRLQIFPLPDVGEGLTEAEILEWKVAEGDVLAINQVMVEIETAKAAVELPSPHAGRVHRLLAEPGVTIEVGTPIIEIDTDPDAGPLGDDDGSSAGRGAGDDAAADDDDATAAGDGVGAGGGDDRGDGGGAKIGQTTADGRVATLVGYIAAEAGATRRPRKKSGLTGPGAGSAVTPDAAYAPAPQGGAGAFGEVAGTGEVAGAYRAAGTHQVTGVHDAPGARPGEDGAHVGGEADAAESLMAPLATPPVRKLAKDWGIDLRTVTAGRADGVISRADLEAARAGRAGDGTVAASLRPGVVPYDPASREYREPIRGVRRMMAQAMVESAFTAPHVTEFLTIDVTPLMDLRARLRVRPDFAETKLTPLAFAARAVCLAARRTPEINCTWDEAAGEVVFKQYVHLGIAAATARGLIVPVIRDADQLDLKGLATALAELTHTARAGKTAPADMAGGTFTITNVGVLGVDTGTPIINPGQSAILALGSIKDAPWVVDGELTVRKVCQLALSFDHRVVDGEAGSRFLADVGALLADPGLALTY